MKNDTNTAKTRRGGKVDALGISPGNIGPLRYDSGALHIAQKRTTRKRRENTSKGGTNSNVPSGASGNTAGVQERTVSGIRAGEQSNSGSGARQTKTNAAIVALTLFIMLWAGCNAKPVPRAQNRPQALSVATIASINAKAISLPVWQKLDTLQHAIDALNAQTVRREAKPRYERELEAFNKPDTTIIHE
jgi:Na+/H+ antiporter NhaC